MATDNFTGRGSVPGNLESFVIHPDGRVEEVRPANGKDFQAEEVNRMVGGHFQLMWLKRRRYMAINEDGKGEKLPLNPTATGYLFDETEMPLVPGEYVVGAVLVCPQRLMP